MTTSHAVGVWAPASIAGRASYIMLKPAAKAAVHNMTNAELLAHIKADFIDTFTDRFGARYHLVTQEVAYALKLTQEAIGNTIVEFTYAIGPCHADGSRDIAIADEPIARTIRSAEPTPASTAYWLRSEATGQHYVIEPLRAALH